jgi:adenylate kinase
MRLLLLAPPGAGQGTQGGVLAAWCGARHIAAGDLLRAEARAGGPLGREIDADQPPESVTADIRAGLSGLARYGQAPPDRR